MRSVRRVIDAATSNGAALQVAVSAAVASVIWRA